MLVFSPFLLLPLIGVSLGFIDCDTSDLDPDHKGDYCDNMDSFSKGTACILKIKDAKPAQSCVGYAYVHCEASAFDGHSEKHVEKILQDKHIPIVVGPGPSFYLQDHHHFARAVANTDLPGGKSQQHVYACVQDDLSSYSVPDFFLELNETKRVWLFARGEPILYTQLPATIADMSDDPFFTLSRLSRDSHAYIKCSQKDCQGLQQCVGAPDTPPFIEAMWGNVLRAKYYYSGMYTEPLSNQVANLTLILPYANQYVQLPAFRSFLGYNMYPTTTQPIINVEIDPDTYCASNPF